MNMKGICQGCGQEMRLIMRNQKQNTDIDDAAIHGESNHLVVEEHEDPRGEHCNGSLIMPEKIVY